MHDGYDAHDLPRGEEQKDYCSSSAAGLRYIFRVQRDTITWQIFSVNRNGGGIARDTHTLLLHLLSSFLAEGYSKPERDT
jgi:hypothetical protein